MWDFLGDIGGLNDILHVIGALIVGFARALSGSELKRFIFKNLFKIRPESSKRIGQSFEESFESEFQNRRPARFKSFLHLFGCCNKKQRLLYGVADRRMNHHLDFV